MERPNYIKECEQETGIMSIYKLTVPEDFDRYLKDKKVELVYSEFILDFESNKTQTKSKIYKTKHGFYLYLSFGDSNIDITIYYKQTQQDELIIFITQLIKQFKNATTNNKRTERKD